MGLMKIFNRFFLFYLFYLVDFNMYILCIYCQGHKKSGCGELNPVSLRPERNVIPIHYTPKIDNFSISDF